MTKPTSRRPGGWLLRLRLLLVLLGALALAVPATASADPAADALAVRGKKKKKKKKPKSQKKEPKSQKKEPKQEWRPRSDGAIDAYNRGADAFNTGDLDAADAALQEALALEPGFGLGGHLRALILLHQTRTDDSIAVLRVLVERFPQREEGWDILAFALFAK